MLDVSEVGKYGTIRLMKNREPDVSVATFPIDDEVVTFGRHPECSIRLYYAWVSSLHCKIVFEDKKAFLQVFGSNGIICDGCQVFPSKTDLPTTIPLINGATFEIHKKRFQFSYPPKELRAQMFTPIAAKRRGSLRMSMINSAQVFSPRPSPNPKENLRILQSPLKPFALASAKGRMRRELDAQPEETVTLVDGNHPKVVEVEQDLIIFEDVELETRPAEAIPQSPTSDQQQINTISPVQQQNAPPPHIDLSQRQPKTPRRRSAPSLHRAVLIRSAQRAAMRQDVPGPQMQTMEGVKFTSEDDDEREAEEVEEAVSAILEEEDEDMDHDDEDGYDDENDIVEDHQAEKLGNDLADVQADSEDGFEQAQAEENLSDEEPAEREQIAAHNTPMRPPRQFFGAFMTPQAKSFLSLNPKTADGPQRPPPGGRFSLGGGLAGMLTPWKVKDIVALQKNVEGEEEAAKEEVEAKVEVKRELTEEEKNAIRQRRRSAVVAPTPDFTHVPGTRRTSALPGPIDPADVSPFKSIRKGLEDGEDVKDALERMRKEVEGWKKKEGNVSPGKKAGVFAPPAAATSNSGEGFSLFSPAAKRYGPAAVAARRMTQVGTFGGRGLFGEGDVVVEETGSQVQRAEEMEVDDGTGEKENESVAVKSTLKITPSTPRLDGLRTLFRPPLTLPNTPSFGGMKEMLDMDLDMENDRRQEQEHDQLQMQVSSGDIQNDGANEDVSRIETSKPPSKAKSKTRATPVRGAASRTTRLARGGGTATDVSTMADDEETSADMTFGVDVGGRPTGGISGKSVRGTRAVKVDEAIVEDEVEEEVKDEVKKPRAKAGSRSKKAVALDEGSDDEMNIASTNTELESDAVTTKPSSRNVRGATATKSSRTAAKSRTTRARSNSVEPTNEGSSDVHAPLPAPVKKARIGTRKPRSRTESSEMETEAETEAEPVDETRNIEVTREGPPRGVRKATTTAKPSSRTTKPPSGIGATRRTTRATSVELDSEPSGIEERPVSPEVEMRKPASKSAGSGRRGRPAATAIVDVGETIDEEDELELKAEKPAKKTVTKGRRTKAAAAQAIPSSEFEDSLPDPPAPAKKRAPSRKTAASTKPNSSSTSAPDDVAADEDGKENDRPVKTKVTKGKTNISTSESTGEDVTAVKPASRARTTRARK